ncbi:MAG: bifunctional glutamate N-acetyltransferase/amino-acid acetyltransferase ArgJ, partial [Candidatus Latescibacteria bacterium]|nr:bifunctional glutamate N-acetyltransferase/amino-acid acetyltransferase ArgJ [Candidatus Latescibacterota bacterium]
MSTADFLIPGDVTTPLGFLAGGIHCGVKRKSLDLALLTSESPCAVAGLFTTNRVKAAPLLVSQKHLADGMAQAIVANSGNANACTGEAGRQDAETMCVWASEKLNLAPKDVLVASTGVIGQRLPMDRIRAGIEAACARLSEHGGMDAEQAIMTTDTVPKTETVEIGGSGGAMRITGMCKGSGMIAPNMATMLAFLMTDAAIQPALLSRLLREAVDRSFNMITVDGDMSTNDFVALLANGAAEVPALDYGSPDCTAFAEALNKLCLSLAKQMARDGEGATKLVTISVRGARDFEEAKQVGMSVANSNLVKTALFGNDPNWGRILAAVGYSGADVAEERITLAIGGLRIFERGKG